MKATNHIIHKILNIKTIAVVGLSNKLDRVSYNEAKYLLKNGYQIIPVNPGYNKILDQKLYPDLRDIPLSVDVVNIFRRSDILLPSMKTAIKISAKAVWFQNGVINETVSILAIETNLLEVINDCMLR
tara:strand:- start:160 stop:543 length:384 start_codon:yes stop_codon:yes gene_type:complete